MRKLQKILHHTGNVLLLLLLGSLFMLPALSFGMIRFSSYNKFDVLGTQDVKLKYRLEDVKKKGGHLQTKDMDNSASENKEVPKMIPDTENTLYPGEKSGAIAPKTVSGGTDNSLINTPENEPGPEGLINTDTQPNAEFLSE